MSAPPAWLEWLGQRLCRSDTLDKADLIFVLAGHRNRKIYGARLFRDAWAPQIILSTGDPPYIARVLETELSPKRFLPTRVAVQIRETSAQVSPIEGMFFAGLNQEAWTIEPISTGWLGTLSEINALGRWLRRHPSISLVLIVSSNLHMRRLGICCRRIFPSHVRWKFIPVPAEEINLSMHGTMPEIQGARRILLEWSKVLLYTAVLFFWHRRTEVAPPSRG
jgi:uncharacterized SAM-binding protein YcdF (DUF218 family)